MTLDSHTVPHTNVSARNCGSIDKTRQGRIVSQCGIIFFLTICVLPLISINAVAQHTYYISKTSGSDSNTSTQAQSKSAPWAHLPGMRTCTSSCASYSPVAGDRFILKGGDTWVSADLNVNWSWSGSSGSPIYIGVDKTWFTGASWVRPIFDCQASMCASNNGNQILQFGSYVTIDNIELKGLKQNGSSISPIVLFADHTIVENCYFHGWSRAAGQSNNGNSFAIVFNTSSGENLGVGNVAHDNVIDGSDTTEDMMNGIEAVETVYNNVIRYVVSGLLVDFTYVYNNLVEYESTSFAGDHCNGIFIFASFNGATNIYAYNNIVRNSNCPGGEVFWIATVSPNVSYIYNNVVYGAGRGIDVGAHPADGSGAVFYAYNNTVEAGGIACVGNGETPPRMTINYENDHCINGTACDSNGATCNNLGGNLNQTLAQADANISPHFDQYTASETYAYSPVASTNSTVGAGNNLTSSCTGNLAALCSDTTYPEYDSVNHVVTFRTTNARSGTWDIGAYEFQVGNPPAPPTNLTAAPQ